MLVMTRSARAWLFSALGACTPGVAATTSTNGVAFFDAATLKPTGTLAIPASDGFLWEGGSDGSALWLAFDASSAGGVLYRATSGPPSGCEFKLGLSGGTLGRALGFYN